MTTELQAYKMSNENILKALQKSCARHNIVLLHADYRAMDMSLSILIKPSEHEAEIVSDMDAILIGLCDDNFEPINVESDFSGIDICPTTLITSDEQLYIQDLHEREGVVLV